MCRKSRNEDKNNIDYNIDVCRHWSSNYYAIGSRHAAQSKQTQNPAADFYTISARQL